MAFHKFSVTEYLSGRNAGGVLSGYGKEAVDCLDTFSDALSSWRDLHKKINDLEKEKEEKRISEDVRLSIANRICTFLFKGRTTVNAEDPLICELRKSYLRLQNIYKEMKNIIRRVKKLNHNRVLFIDSHVAMSDIRHGCVLDPSLCMEHAEAKSSVYEIPRIPEDITEEMIRLFPDLEKEAA